MSDKFCSRQEVRDGNLSVTTHHADGLESPPRISEALIHAMPADTKSPDGTPPALGKLNQAGYVPTMQALFKLVHKRLMAGLDEAWRSTWGYDGDLDPSEEEQWARQFSEMFVFTAYEGPSQTFGTMGEVQRGKYDMPYLRRIEQGQQDPVYTPFGACQHIANYMIVTRGIPTSDFDEDGLGAGKVGGCTAFTWITVAKNPKLGKTAITAVNTALGGDGPLTPGSMFVFEPETTSRHIGGVLRLSKNRERYQPMDTGVLAGMDDTGTADHNGKDGLGGAKPRLVGVGVLKAAKPMVSYLSFLKTARPLGFAHFVVIDPAKQVRYISRALPMYDGDTGFAVTRYVWSLRCLPLEGRACWILSTFNVNYAKAAAAALVAPGARGKSLSELGAGGVSNGKLFLRLNVLQSTMGIPDEGGQGAGVLVYRRKYKASDDWALYRGGTSTYKDNSFPGLLGEAKAEGHSFYEKWSAMGPDDEWTQQDPAAQSNVQLISLSRGAPYFPMPISPAQESETRAPLPRELK